jgi:translation initiation factor IF-3
MIRIPQVRVVDEEGAQLGVMPTPQALEMAQERGLDLVEVAPMASPPVVKFLDFGQYKYELTKRDKEAKRKQRSVTFKEVRLKPKIGIGDFDTKVRRAIQFLEEGDRIKVAVQFRGRELTHPEIGRALLARFSEQIKDHGAVERAPLLEGKSMHITVASTHKPKVIEHVSKHGSDTDTTAPAAVTAELPTPTEEAPATEDAPATAAATPAPVLAAEAAEAPAPAEAPPTAAAPAPVASKPAIKSPVTATATKTARAKVEPKPATTPRAAPAAEKTKSAPRPTRTRKIAEPGAPAPASAGE